MLDPEQTPSLLGRPCALRVCGDPLPATRYVYVEARAMTSCARASAIGSTSEAPARALVVPRALGLRMTVAAVRPRPC